MDFKVDINPEDINKAIIAAVTNSLIGEQIKKVVTARVEEFGKSYNNPLEPIVNQLIAGMVREVLTNEFKEPLEKMVRERLTPEIQTMLTDKAWNALLNN